MSWPGRPTRRRQKKRFCGNIKRCGRTAKLLEPQDLALATTGGEAEPSLPIGLRRGYDGSEPEPIARKPLPTETPRIEPVRPQAAAARRR